MNVGRLGGLSLKSQDARSGLTRLEWEKLDAWRSEVFANFPYNERHTASAMATLIALDGSVGYVTALDVQGELARQHSERKKVTIKRHLQTLADRGFVEARYDDIPVRYRPKYSEPALLPIKATTFKTKGINMNTVLHKDGNSNFAIVTTAETEEEFRGQFAAALDEMIGANTYAGDWPFHLNGWIEQASEVICKYRGYKTQVVERRTIIAGVLDPDAAVLTVGHQETPAA